MPPLPLVAFEVISARTGTPASLPAPTPTPTPVPTPGPCLTGRVALRPARRAAPAGRPSSPAGRSPAALRRAASISPGGLSGSGTRASGTGASLLSATLAGASYLREACGLIGSGLLVATCFSTGTCLTCSGLSLTAAGGGGGGLSSSNSLAIGAASAIGCVRSGSCTGSQGRARKKIRHAISTHRAICLKR